MAFVQQAIKAFYAVDVRMLRFKALPKNAWYAPRKRYRAEILLDYLETIRPKKNARILGITRYIHHRRASQGLGDPRIRLGLDLSEAAREELLHANLGIVTV